MPPATDPADGAGRGGEGSRRPGATPTGGGALPPNAEATPGGSGAMVIDPSPRLGLVVVIFSSSCDARAAFWGKSVSIDPISYVRSVMREPVDNFTQPQLSNLIKSWIFKRLVFAAKTCAIFFNTFVTLSRHFIIERVKNRQKRVATFQKNHTVLYLYTTNIPEENHPNIFQDKIPMFSPLHILSS